MITRYSDFIYLQIAALNTLRESSRRVYRHTYELWCDWCHNAHYNPLNLHPENILQFLESQPVTRATRQRQYAAMKKLLQIMAITSEDARRAYEYLNLVPMPEGNLSDKERDLGTLTIDQITAAVHVWRGSDPIHLRNHALIWLMVATALRRSEILDLTWQDIDLDRGVLTVRHGKGNKRREVAIVYDQAIKAMLLWQSVNAGRYIFRPMNNLGKLLDDKPMSADNLYRIVQVVKKETGVYLTPHTLRRTLATDLIAGGASISDVQDQLGHASPNTLFEHYVKAAGVEQRRERFKKHASRIN